MPRKFRTWIAIKMGSCSPSPLSIVRFTFDSRLSNILFILATHLRQLKTHQSWFRLQPYPGIV